MKPFFMGIRNILDCQVLGTCCFATESLVAYRCPSYGPGNPLAGANAI